SAGVKKDGTTAVPAWFTTATDQRAIPFNPNAPAAGGPLTLTTGADTCPGGCDPAKRPIRPAMFCTDITDANTNKGDWQIIGGTGTPPDFVTGTWKSASSTVTCSDNGTVTTCTVATTVGIDPLVNVTHPSSPTVWNAGPDAD